MPINFNSPVSTDAYATLLTELQNGRKALAQMLDPASAGTLLNVPVGAKRLTVASGLFEIFDGTSWGDMPVGYAKKAGDDFSGTVTAPGFTTTTRFFANGFPEGLRLDPVAIGADPYISFYTNEGAGTGRRAFLMYRYDVTAAGGFKMVNEVTGDQLVVDNYGNANSARFYDADTLTYHPIWHSGNLTPGNYLLLAGGAMSGDLTSTSAGRFGGAAYGTLGVRQGGAYGGAGPLSALDDLVVESNAASAGLSILTPNSGYGGIFFGDPEGAATGQIRYNHPDDTFKFYTAGSNLRASISATGLAVTADITMNGLRVGYLGIPSLASTATATAAAVGKVYKQTVNQTVPASVFAADDVYFVYNNSGASISLIQGAGLTLRLAGTATQGTRTLAQRGWAKIWFLSPTEAVVDGVT